MGRAAGGGREGTVRRVTVGAAVLWLGLAVVLPAPGRQAGRQDLPKLVDVTRQAGINFVYNTGDSDITNIIESNAGGCAFLDYDGDGDLDIYFVNGAYVEGFSAVPGRRYRGKLANALYRNNGDGTFTDVTAQAGVGDKGMGMGVSVADYDNDGHPDLFVTNYGRNVLYHNNGDGTFTDVTRNAGLASDSTLSSTGSTWLDYDNDGYLDLFVGHYVKYDPSYQYYYAAQRFPGPLAYHGQPDVLYHNNRDGTFTDVTRKAGVYNPEGRAMGVGSADIDDDGNQDIFVPNDGMENYLYRNKGNGTFTNIAIQSGTALSERGEAASAMTPEFGDIDLDGRIDVFVPDLAYCSLYMNRGDGLFEDMSARMGIALACGQYTSWSANLFDLDHDGYPDLFISNGHPQRMIGEEDMLLLNDHGQRFVNVSQLLGPDLQEKLVSRGSCAADFDNDGDMDVLEVNLNQRARLLRNDGGNRRNWVMIRLVGTTSNRDGIGTRVRLTAGGKTQTRWRVSGGGYLSSGDPRLHFGLGDSAGIDRIEIRWPSGKVQALEGQRPDQIITVTEPSR
jgi:hypothetical protein